MVLFSGTHQVDEREEFPAAAIGLVSWNVESFEAAQDGEVGEQNGDPQHLRGDESHVAAVAAAADAAAPLP